MKWEELLKFQRPINDAAVAVARFFETLQGSVEAKTLDVSHLCNDDLVLAAIRLLGVWLAEETNALPEDVNGILPLLSQIINQSEQDDALLFLLPGLCHLSSEASSRDVLLQSNLHTIMSRRIMQTITLDPTQSSINALNAMFSVMLNFVLLEPRIATESAFLEFSSFLSSQLHTWMSADLMADHDPSLVGNVIVTVLNIERKRASATLQSSVFDASLSFIVECMSHPDDVSFLFLSFLFFLFVCLFVCLFLSFVSFFRFFLSFLSFVSFFLSFFLSNSSRRLTSSAFLSSMLSTIVRKSPGSSRASLNHCGPISENGLRRSSRAPSRNWSMI
jgi:hypothetical protein